MRPRGKNDCTVLYCLVYLERGPHRELPFVLWKASEYSALSIPRACLRCSSRYSDTSKDLPLLIMWSAGRAESLEGHDVLGHAAGDHGVSVAHPGRAGPHKYTPKDGAQITDKLLQLIFTNLQKERKPKQVLPPLPYRVGNWGLWSVKDCCIIVWWWNGRDLKVSFQMQCSFSHIMLPPFLFFFVQSSWKFWQRGRTGIPISISQSRSLLLRGISSLPVSSSTSQSPTLKLLVFLFLIVYYYATLLLLSERQNRLVLQSLVF